MPYQNTIVDRECACCGGRFTTTYQGRRTARFCSFTCSGKAAPHPRRNAATRFWALVSKSDDALSCWPWMGARDPKGYGMFMAEPGDVVFAHRFALELDQGPIPAGMFGCHRCDNPGCVRNDGPNSHLFAGTPADNSHDAMAKGRSKPPPRYLGAANPAAKLSEDGVRAMRAANGAGENQYELARRYGLSQSTVWDVLHHRTWKHVP